MIKQHSSRLILTVFALLAMLLGWAWSANLAYADQAGAQVSIVGNGQTTVKRATVTAVTGSRIEAETVWGSMKIAWTVETTGSTSFYPNASSREALKTLKIGDTISISGSLVLDAARPTISANVVRNLTLSESAAAAVAAPSAPAATAPASTASGSWIPTPFSSTGTSTFFAIAVGAGLAIPLWRYREDILKLVSRRNPEAIA